MGLPPHVRPGSRDPLSARTLALAAALALLALPAAAQIRINEIYPNPLGSETGTAEKVEIYNAGLTPVDLTGWAIDDAATIGTVSIRAGIPENLDPACSTDPIIQPGEFRVVFMSGSSGVLNNTGDTVYLISDRLAAATVVHAVTYPGPAPETQSWACAPNGSNNFSFVVTATLCSSNGGPVGDVTPPATVSDLAVSPGQFPGEVRLTWTAPGDDGVAGTASGYIIKVAHSAITAGGFDAAADLDRWLTEPLPGAGASAETLFVYGLATDSTWFFAIKAQDEVPNTSAISNSPGSAPLAGTMLNPNLGYQHYYGNLHSHTSYSDGVQTPAQAFAYARGSAPTPLDFLAVTEHNHNGAGMVLGNYPLLKAEAAAANDDGNFVAIFGQEWGIISTGGHANLFEAPPLFGWEPGNYDVFVAEGDYTGLYTAFRNNPPAGGLPPVVEWCHPSGSDFNNYALTGDGKAVVSLMAMVSGPAFSTSTTESDVGSFTGNESLFHDALRKGYRVSPTVDQDNHNATWGAATEGRTVVLASGRTKSQILGALAARHAYASMDHNTQVLMSVEEHPMGDAWTAAQGVRIVLQVTDPDPGDGVAQIELLRGITGVSNATVVATNSGSSSFAWRERQVFPAGTEAHYFARIRMNDNAQLWTGPVYVKYDPAAVTAVGDRPAEGLALAAGPNPSYGRVRATFALPSATDDAELALYDASGRRVKTLIGGPLAAGTQSVEWTGTDESGRPVPAGIFFMRLRAGGRTAVQKVLLVR